jgi:hypothetical protein
MHKVKQANEREPSPGGWLVRTSQGYYTGQGRSQLERWTVFPKWAKVYTRKGWAEKIAKRFGGQVVPVAEPAPALVPGQQSARQAQAIPAP